MDAAAEQQDEQRVPRLDIVLPPSADGSSFEMYRAASAPHAAISLPDGANAADFFVDGATWQLPHAVLSRVRSSAQIISRTDAEIARDDAPTIQIYFQVDGDLTGTCEGNPEHFNPGDVGIRDSRRGQVVTANAFDVRILMMARERVPIALLSPAVHGLKLPGERAGTRVLAGTMELLAREMDELSLSEADHAVAALFEMTAGLVETELLRRGSKRKRFIDPQLDSVMTFIDQSFNDAALNSEIVRRHAGLSRTALYRLFQPLGGVDGAIRQRRLDAAMRSLFHGVGPTPDIAELTRRHGFRNEINFSRAFQARFGVTPGRFRSKVVEGDSAFLAEQAARAGFASLEAWRSALVSNAETP